MRTNNFNNMVQFINIVKSNRNPEQMVVNMLKERAQSNPTFANLVTLAEQGKTRDMEVIVRNIAKEKGIDFDKEFNSFKQMFKL